MLLYQEYHLQGAQYVRFKTTASDKLLSQGSTVGGSFVDVIYVRKVKLV